MGVDICDHNISLKLTNWNDSTMKITQAIFR